DAWCPDPGRSGHSGQCWGHPYPRRSRARGGVRPAKLAPSPGPRYRLRVRWDDALEQFHKHLAVERARSRLTVAAYLRDIAAFRDSDAAADSRSPGTVTVTEVRAYLASLFGKNDRASIARKLSSLRTFFRYLEKVGELSSNPAASVRAPRRRRP